MADASQAVGESRQLMLDFAERTGLKDEAGSGRRYLWTDAHAVCNFLSLNEATGDDAFRGLARILVERVHAELGRHREDDPREGWISGLDEAAGREHPTAGGLRIGKPQNERSPGERYDPAAEWDRDGQYFHYLTKWMHALCRMYDDSGEEDYLRWAAELAVAAYEGFLVRDPATGRHFLAWKMRIDLSEPLVPSTGLHDPLDGFITGREIEFLAIRSERGPDPATLRAAISAFEGMLLDEYPATDDPLGIGGVLFDATRLAQLVDAGHSTDRELLASLVESARTGLDAVIRGGTLDEPAERRLAFRELGLSIGLNGSAMMRDIVDRGAGAITGPAAAGITGLERYETLISKIERFWRDPGNRSARTWTGHRDINEVMLATSLVPAEFLRV